MTTVPPFRSDNIAGACTEVIEAIAKTNSGVEHAYGGDALSAALDETMSRLFERRCWCFPVGTGTAANALALAAVSGPETLIACHERAHILCNEDAAVELISPSARLVPLPGDAGRISPGALDTFARRHSGNGRWAALSLTQLTEAGTVYGLDQTAALAGAARRAGARVHMDGARFANAAVALGATPADVTWRAGVDVLSLGATKNGSLNADAVVAFDEGLSNRIRANLRRTGQLYSKMRFMAAQLLTLFEGDLWISNARHANSMARRLADSLSGCHGVEIVHSVNGNHVFLRLEEAVAAGLERTGMMPWRSGTDERGRPIYRLVTSFATEADEVDRFAAALRGPEHPNRR